MAWLYVVVPIVVMLVVGLIIDIVARIKGKKINLSKDNNKGRNETGDMYSVSLDQDS